MTAAALLAAEHLLRECTRSLIRDTRPMAMHHANSDNASGRALLDARSWTLWRLGTRSSIFWGS